MPLLLDSTWGITMTYDISNLVEPLTPREEEVFGLLTERGLTNKEIAKQLGIRTSTVEKHFSSIYGKLGVDGRSEAILWAYRHRTLESTDS